VARDAEGTETIIDEVGRGDTVGEGRLLTGDVLSAAVYAVRDSAVGVITRPLFENLKLQYPEAMTRLARIALRRVQRQAATPGAFHASDAVGFAVLAVGTPGAAYRSRPLQSSWRRPCRLVGRPYTSAALVWTAFWAGRASLRWTHWTPRSLCWPPGCSDRSTATVT
jgi:hypothetical protein